MYMSCVTYTLLYELKKIIILKALLLFYGTNIYNLLVLFF